MNRINISNEIKSFIHQHKTLVILTLGLAIPFYSLGVWGRHAIAWIKKGHGTTQKVTQVTEQVIKNESPKIFKDEGSYKTPKRRVCGCGFMVDGNILKRAKNTLFVSDKEIVQIHPMKFLPSPFKKSFQKNENLLPNELFEVIKEDDQKKEKALGFTKNGKHVLLQMAIRSCVSTCVAMLLLDYGKHPNFELIESSDLATDEEAMKQLSDKGLKPTLKKVPNQNAIEFLSLCLNEKGSGILSVKAPGIGGHVVILDEISLETKEATIRDPFHGWMVTINSDALKSWLYLSTFIQVV